MAERPQRILGARQLIEKQGYSRLEPEEFLGLIRLDHRGRHPLHHLHSGRRARARAGTQHS